MTAMQRTDRRITDLAELRDIVDRADTCRVAFVDGEAPHIVPLCFGYAWYDRLVLYFHCAREGRKINLLKSDNRVCFEMDIDHEIVRGATPNSPPCAWGMKFRSIVGYGTIEPVTDEEERKRGLDLIMAHYGFPGQPEYHEKALAVTEILKVEVSEISGKKRG